MGNTCNWKDILFSFYFSIIQIYTRNFLNCYVILCHCIFIFNDFFSFKLFSYQKNETIIYIVARVYLSI